MKAVPRLLAVLCVAVAFASPVGHVFAADDSSSAAEAGEPHGAEHDTHATATHGGLDPDLAIVTAIVFLVLLAVLGKFAWGPIVEMLDRREKAIADEIAMAKQQNEQAKQLLADHEARLAGTADEVRRILDDARRDADEHKQNILAEAQQAASAEKTRAVREIEAAKNSALQSIAQKSVDTAVDLAGKIVQRQLNSDDHAALIGEALQRFPSEN